MFIFVIGLNPGVSVVRVRTTGVYLVLARHPTPLTVDDPVLFELFTRCQSRCKNRETEGSLNRTPIEALN